MAHKLIASPWTGKMLFMARNVGAHCCRKHRRGRRGQGFHEHHLKSRLPEFPPSILQAVVPGTPSSPWLMLWNPTPPPSPSAL